ncbi:hypothetical protein BEN47_06085 [Hymenobacter lapidarius]|uniref:Phage head morphogenesis domain-containing protein n=1 Tax=Hymenobacter lapidarius TaxID=1908237 RepID=A0A1G1SQC6_9BACT|nr:hypothetical protein [Hymenobacter lapidarius]OGX80823.1 hypothetical protein BEN47_06085 [Hymenobacter lapidarius]
MLSPEEAAAARSAAVEALQAQLARDLTTAQREMLRGLLNRLEDTLADPALIAQLLAEYTAAVAVPLAVAYAQSLLLLPALQLDYFAALGLTNYRQLRAPLTGLLETRLGITAAGVPVPGGYLSTLVGDTTAQRELLRYAYQAQATGVGLGAYRQGLETLVTGGNGATGLMERLYKEANDTYNEADRTLQHVAAEELGLSAYLYQGGLIKSSRAFCKVRNGRVFLRSEIARFGTSADAYGGYRNKAAGEFDGRPDPYEPLVQAGGYSCRHTFHAISNSIALSRRPDLMEDGAGKLVLRT